MAQAGAYAPTSVIQADAVVRVNGVVREHISMEWSGDTTGGLPEQVVSAGTGMRTRTGSIRWAQQEEVESEPPHPLRQSSGWPPREGDVVEIDASVIIDGIERTWRRFTGRLGRTTGSLTDGTLTSQVTDTLGDSLGELVTVPPLIWASRSELSSWSTAYRALEQAGLGYLPAPDSDTILHFAGQGESTVAIGTTPASITSRADAAYGLWVRSGRVVPVAAPRLSRDVLVIGRGSRLWRSWVQVTLSDESQVRLDVLENRTMTLHVNGAQVWVGAWVGDQIPTLAFQLLSSGVRVWTSRTVYSTVVPTVLSRTATVLDVTIGETAGASARYLSSGVRGPAVVASLRERPVAWRRSAITTEEHRSTRGVENATARSVIDAWSEATLTSLWMDELGTPVIRPRDILAAAAPYRTVRVDERIFAGSWSIGDDQVRSRVVIKGQQGLPQQAAPGEYRLTVHQESSTRAFEGAASVERFIEAPTDTEWGPVDVDFGRFGSPGPPNVGIEGSWVGAVTADNSTSDVENWAQLDSVTYLTSAQRLGQRTLKITETVDAVPAGKTLYLKTKAVTTAHPAMRDTPMPVIRAEWLSTWAEYTVTGNARGPAWAPALEHDGGWFLTPGDAQRVADALSAEVTKTMPTLSGVSLLWDPTRQIGDVEEWVATSRDGAVSWSARVLVVGYSESWDGSVPTQSVDVRVISWTDPLDGKTYADLAAAYATYGAMSGTYQQTYDALPSAR